MSNRASGEGKGAGKDIASTSPSTPRRRVPLVGLAQFGIPLGIAGSAGAWTAAKDLLAVPSVISDTLWAIAGIFYLIFLVGYVAQRITGPASIRGDLDHPVLGPSVANIPIIGDLMLTHFGKFVPEAAPWLAWILVAASLTVAGRLFATWLSSDFTLASIHPGFFFPVVAASFIGSLGLTSAGQTEGATAAFGIGVFFWLVVGTIVTNRLITGGPLPDFIKPTLVILAVPPAVGGVAWMAMHDGRIDAIAYSLFGIDVVLVVVQLMLFREYRKLSFSQSFWTFTFPLGVTTNFAIRFFGAEPFPGSVAISWALLVIASAGVLAISYNTVALAARTVRAGRAISRTTAARS